ncbi:MAG: RDD family protein [Agarilytica sp.]
MSEENIYQAPDSNLGREGGGDVQYAGFWIRVLASLVDTILMMVIILPVLTMIYGESYWGRAGFSAGLWDVLMNYVFPGLAVVIFWVYKSATPGKLLFSLKIVDSNSFEKPSVKQLVGRYICYYISSLPLFLGFFWIAIDQRKQGWHDKLSGTVVVKN